MWNSKDMKRLISLINKELNWKKTKNSVEGWANYLNRQFTEEEL